MARITEICRNCNIEFNLPRYKKQVVDGGYCCSEECCNDWWNAFYVATNSTLEPKYIQCKTCNCNSIRVYANDFCSKGCYLSFRNQESIKDGSHNFGSDFSRKSAQLQVLQGKHPFQKGNMDEETLNRKYKGISKARKEEASKGTHLWQRPEVWINNEFSRSLNVANKRGLTEASLYISDCELDDHFKIGWTTDINMREADSRTWKLKNLKVIKIGTPEEIITLEKEVKLRFFNREFSVKHKSTEIFLNTIKGDVLDFISKFNKNV